MHIAVYNNRFIINNLKQLHKVGMTKLQFHFEMSILFKNKTKQKQKVNADRQENDYILVPIWISYLLRTLT